jgi:GntR family transcriptional regulator
MARPIFYIQPQSDIPASTQLFNQIGFAIASNQFQPGTRLPSLRQLAMQTGLHRNTISRVYNQLEEIGLIEARAGSGIYVRERATPPPDTGERRAPVTEVRRILQKALHELGELGYSLEQARELFLTEVDWRRQCSAQVIVTVPAAHAGIGPVMATELTEALGIPIQCMLLEDLPSVLAENPSVTLVTTRYFVHQVEALNAARQARILAVKVYTYEKELEAIAQLPVNSCVGLVSISPEILQVAEVIVHSRFGEERFVIVARSENAYQLRTVVRRAQLVISDRASLAAVEGAMREVRPLVIRSPEILCSGNYISAASIAAIRRELELELL